MKKGLAIGLIGLVAAGTLASAAPAFADDTTTYQGVSSGETEFVGRIGQFDPEEEDPGNGMPPAGDQGWIKVKLPTKILYWSTAQSKHKDIASGKHTISNLSNYPVKVSLKEFKGKTTAAPEIDGLEDLYVNSFKLVSAKAVQSISATSLTAKLTAGGKIPATGTMTGSSTWDLSVTGKVATGLTSTPKVLDNKLVFSFEALDANGDEVTAPAAP